MMDTPEISIIVPIYRVEKYLDDCVRSIQKQTFANLEIILVDDGSPDHCGAMCDSYAKEDSRIRVIHKSNGGLSDARNAGIEIARGEYLGFVDSDDMIAPDMYETLYHIIKQKDADIAVCGVQHCYKNSMRPADSFHSAECSVYFADTWEAIRLLLEAKDITASCCTKLYKRAIFSDIRFPVGKLMEDAFVIVCLMERASLTAITTAKKYYYMHRENSITSIEYHSQVQDMIEAWKNNYIFIKERCPALIPQGEYRYFNAVFFVLDRMMLSPKNVNTQEKKETIEIIRQNIKVILQNPFFQKKRKAAALGLMLHEDLYKICVHIYGKRNKLIE